MPCHFGKASSSAFRYAERVQRQLNDAMDVSRFIATSLVSFKKAGGMDRAQLNAWLKGTAEANHEENSQKAGAITPVSDRRAVG